LQPLLQQRQMPQLTPFYGSHAPAWEP